MGDNKDLYIEEIVLNAVKKLLTGRVNELLGEMERPIPPIELGRSMGGAYAIAPVVRLCACERNEKERIVRLDVYTLTVAMAVPEHPAGELNAYAYAAAVAMALREDPILDGTADRAELTGKKYNPPNCAGTGAEWEIILTLRISVEADGYGD
jgi:hypothetical protein